MTDFDTDELHVNPPPKKERPSAKSPADKPMDATLSSAQLRKQLTLNFNALMKVFKLPDVPEDEPGPGILHFDETVFQNPADGFIILVNEHAQLRILARLLAPAAAILEMFATFDRIRRAFALQREMRNAKKAAEKATFDAATAPDDSNSNGVTPRERTAGRAFGR